MTGRPGASGLSYVNIARAKLFAEIRRKVGQRMQVWTMKEGTTYVGYAITEIFPASEPFMYVGEIYLEPEHRHQKDLKAFFGKSIREIARKLGIKIIHYKKVVR